MAAPLAYLLLGCGLIVLSNRGDADAALWLGTALSGGGLLLVLAASTAWNRREVRRERGPAADEPGWFWDGLDSNRPSVFVARVRTVEALTPGPAAADVAAPAAATRRPRPRPASTRVAST